MYIFSFVRVTVFVRTLKPQRADVKKHLFLERLLPGGGAEEEMVCSTSSKRLQYKHKYRSQTCPGSRVRGRKGRESHARHRSGVSTEHHAHSPNPFPTNLTHYGGQHAGNRSTRTKLDVILITSRRRPLNGAETFAGRLRCFIPARDRRTCRVRTVFSHAVTDV